MYVCVCIHDIHPSPGEWRHLFFPLAVFKPIALILCVVYGVTIIWRDVSSWIVHLYVIGIVP